MPNRVEKARKDLFNTLLGSEDAGLQVLAGVATGVQNVDDDDFALSDMISDAPWAFQNLTNFRTFSMVLRGEASP